MQTHGLGTRQERIRHERSVRRHLVVEAVRCAAFARVDHVEDEVFAQQRLPAEEDDPRVLLAARALVDRREGGRERHVARPVPRVAVSAREVAAVSEMKSQVHSQDA